LPSQLLSKGLKIKIRGLEIKSGNYFFHSHLNDDATKQYAPANMALV